MNRSPRPRRAATPALVTVALLVLGACGDGSSSSTTAAPSGSEPATTSSAAPSPDAADGPDDGGAGEAGPSSPATSTESAAVPEVLDFEATTTGGDTFAGSSVAGRPVVLWFWAPWCAVCKSQVSEVADLAEQYGDDVAFLGVGSLSDAGAIADFADEAAGPTHLSDPDGALYQRFEITEQSSFVVLDAEGGEVLRTGYADDDQLAGAVEDLVG